MRSRAYVLAFVVLLLVYIGLTFGLPVDPATLERYKLSEFKVRLINLTVVIPLVAIWLTALFGFVNLKKYAQAIAHTKEGRAFNYLAWGLMVLAFSLPLNSIAGFLVRYLSRNNSELVMPLTITRNHLAVLFAIATFWLLMIGARALTKTVQKAKLYIPESFAIGLIALSALYAWLITAKPFNNGAEERAFFLPSGVLVLTLVIPYVLAWRAGLVAMYHMFTFHQKVKGVIYKSAFRDLAAGIGVTVLVSVLIQLITTSSAQLNRLNLTPILLIVYGLLILYAVGFGLVARGAKKLKRLEEV